MPVNIEQLEKQVEEGEKLRASVYNAGGEKKDLVPQTPEAEKTKPEVKPEGTPVTEDTVKEQAKKQEPAKQKKKKSEETVPLHKYKSLEGKYNAEIQRQYTQIQEQQREIDKLRDMVIEMQKKESAVKEPESRQPERVQIPRDAVRKYITDKDIDEFGQPTVDLVTRIASGIAEEALTNYNSALSQNINRKFAEYEQKFNPIVQEIDTVKNTQARTVYDWFTNEMRKNVKDYDLYVNSPQFLEWLDQPDEAHPDWTNRSFYDTAVSYGNVAEAARIFNRFLKTVDMSDNSDSQINETMVANQPQDNAESVSSQRPIFVKDGVLVYEDGTPVDVGVTGNVVKTTNIPLNLISPPKSVSGDIGEGVKDSGQKPVRHYSEITKAVKDVERGIMSYEDYQKLQREIDEALKEGRLEL